MARLRTDRGLDRLVNFSDAAVAIAITLLILPLVDLAGELHRNESFGDFFVEHVGAFIAFFVTFAVIGRFWVTHHRVFEAVATYSSALLWVNLLWLAAIVFLPFAANAVAQLTRESGSFYALYVGTILAGTLGMVGIELVLLRRPGLLREDGRDVIDPTIGLGMALTLVVAGVLAYFLPQVGLLWLLLLFLTRPVSAMLRLAFPGLRAAR